MDECINSHLSLSAFIFGQKNLYLRKPYNNNSRIYNRLKQYRKALFTTPLPL